MTTEPTISREELERIVDEAIPERYAESTKAKLRRVATEAPAVAVLWFHCNGVRCPASQARLRNAQTFQGAFDHAMAAACDRPSVLGRAFVVKVVDP